MSEPSIEFSDERRRRLESLRNSDKFAEDIAEFYSGAASEADSRKFNEYANQMINAVLLLGDNIQKREVLELFLPALNKFNFVDTDDRERIAFVCEQVMDIFEIESSDGLLNEWLYGFDPTVIANDA